MLQKTRECCRKAEKRNYCCGTPITVAEYSLKMRFDEIGLKILQNILHILIKMQLGVMLTTVPKRVSESENIGGFIMSEQVQKNFLRKRMIELREKNHKSVADRKSVV